MQDTGFSEWLAADEGVLAFNDPEEALHAVQAVNARYTRHCRAAREVAEAYFDAGKVLPHLIERALAPEAVAPGRASP
jgi:hypothetical protein